MLIQRFCEVHVRFEYKSGSEEPMNGFRAFFLFRFMASWFPD